MDECHRDTFGEMMGKIKETFPYAMFFGFSGTPIKEENRKKGCTSADVFGDELKGTRYTIGDGIRDGNVKSCSKLSKRLLILKFDTSP